MLRNLREEETLPEGIKKKKKKKGFTEVVALELHTYSEDIGFFVLLTLACITVS